MTSIIRRIIYSLLAMIFRAKYNLKTQLFPFKKKFFFRSFVAWIIIIFKCIWTAIISSLSILLIWQRFHFFFAVFFFNNTCAFCYSFIHSSSSTNLFFEICDMSISFLFAINFCFRLLPSFVQTKIACTQRNFGFFFFRFG